MKYTKINNDTLKLSFNIPTVDNKFDTLSDKYLYNGNKTIGFRKDKKLEKFVGLRDGSSKQLEFSIKSIVIDGEEKIKSNRLYFNDIELVDDVVIHKINNIEIYNKIDASNYRNLVKIDSSFDTVDILYQVELKGVKINNKSQLSNNTVTYYPSYENTFNIVDEDNNQIYFIIDNPIAFTSDNIMLDIVQHELYMIDEILYYKKTIRDFNFYSKDKNYLPLYVDANIQFNITNYYSITKLSNEVLLTPNYVDGINGISIWSDFLTKNENGNYNKKQNYTNLVTCDVSLDETYNTYNVGKNVKLSRHYFSFDTSLLSDLGQVTPSSVKFNFYYNNKTVDTPLVLQKSTFLGTSPTSIDWFSFEGNPYENNYNVSTFNTDTILNIPTTDINISGLTNFMLRSSIYDYNEVLPTQSQLINIDNSIMDSSLDVEFTVKLNERRTIQIPLSQNGFGVLSSIGNTYDEAKSGTTVTNVHSSSIGTYSYSVGYKYINSQQHLNRTFLSFDTTILSYYNTNNVIKSINLKFNLYNLNRTNFALYKGSSVSNTLDVSDWNSATQYIDTYNIKNGDNSMDILISKNLFNDSGLTNFVLTDDYYDRLNNYETRPTDLFSGIDFNSLKLEIVVEPYLINGLNYKQIIDGQLFTLTASKNIDFGTIKWYDNKELTNQVGQNNTVTLNSYFYKNGDFIYGIITDGNNIKISSNILKVELNIIDNVYGVLPINNRVVTTDVVDIDSVYFKYENAMSGVCYSYFRELDDVYENTNMVSDGDDIGSYNLYNEYDIINEFYSNVTEVEVVSKLNDIDLNKSYKEIDGQIIHEGTRVLLYSTTPSVNDGIYVANYNLKLIKESDMTDSEKLFRLKINVNSGTYLDYEFHTYYYEYDEETNNPSNGTFEFDLFDASLYGETIIDMGTYFNTIFDSNI